MADFVAVIRRAVDGLADNNPEMRVKVYERARGAVRRQLESMKPRPPEEMLRRQLDKLEAAIQEVEAEHAEAMPVGDEVAAAAPVIEAAVIDEPQPAPAEEHQEAAAHIEAEEPQYSEPETLQPEPVRAQQREFEQPVQDETAWQQHSHEELPPEASPVEEQEPVEEWHDVPQPVHAVEAEPIHEEPPAPVVAPPAAAAESEPAIARQTHPSQDDVISQVEEIWADVDARGRQSEAGASAAIPAAAFAPGAFGHPVEPAPAANRMPEADKAAFAWDADVFQELLQPAPAQDGKQAPPARPAPGNGFDDVELFSDVHAPVKKAGEDVESDGWRELKELAGFDKFTDDGRGDRPAAASDFDQVMASKLQGKSYRMEPKRRRFGIAGIVLTLVFLAIVGGGGYAAWLYRDTLNKMVADLISSAAKTGTEKPVTQTAANNAGTPATAPATSQPNSTPAATAPAQNNVPAQNNAAAPSNAPATKPPTSAGNGNTDVASLANDPNVVNNKFTQRLLSSGSEEDGGPAPTGQPGVAEGKSVAEQNVAAAAPAAGVAAPPASEANATQPQASAAQTAPAATQPPAGQQPDAAAQQQSQAQQPPPAASNTQVADGQKVFLYEERLGQPSPAAFQGTVTWSLQEVKGDDGRPSPSVQGLINVPDRGLTATITLSRNTDSSLPASHLVELAFQLPPNFEGGAIDSVQRIALKATEQDRGDPLIAVPAKVTDDVYMVALNDFPDARKTNLDLLKNRNWIDIPVVYRNGRRALLTMEKGAAGTDAINKAIAEWAALGGDATASSQ
jgi:hypothetical protein